MISRLCVLVLFAMSLAPAAWAGGKAEKAPAIVISPTAADVFTKPASHTAEWVRVHGSFAPQGWNEGRQSSNECLMCHTRSDCLSCHTGTPPDSHTITWRTFGHGFQAEVDRTQCQTCHTQDTCVRCHNETPPQSHTADWTSQHCSVCHVGPTGTPGGNCSVCHKSSPHS